MFCFTSAAQLASMPATALAPYAASVEVERSEMTSTSKPPITKGTASSSPSTCIVSKSGVERKVAATAAGNQPPSRPASRIAATTASSPRSRSGITPPSSSATSKSPTSNGGRSTK